MTDELKDLLDQMTPVETEILNSILAEDTDVATEGVMIKRQNWTTQNLLDKKINKTVMLIARLKGDPMYAKFDKFFKLSRVWRAKLRAKYYGMARGIVLANGGLKADNLSQAVREKLNG